MASEDLRIFEGIARTKLTPDFRKFDKFAGKWKWNERWECVEDPPGDVAGEC